jgi:hypothetical protein
MGDERRLKSPAIIRWTLAVLLAYPLSVGPAAWSCRRLNAGMAWSVYGTIYKPVVWAAHGTDATTRAFACYVNFGRDPDPDSFD